MGDYLMVGWKEILVAVVAAVCATGCVVGGNDSPVPAKLQAGFRRMPVLIEG